MVAFLFQQQKAPCHFSLLVTPISLRIFSILLQKRRQYCLLRIQELLQCSNIALNEIQTYQSGFIAQSG